MPPISRVLRPTLEWKVVQLFKHPYKKFPIFKTLNVSSAGSYRLLFVLNLNRELPPNHGVIITWWFRCLETSYTYIQLYTNFCKTLYFGSLLLLDAK